MGQYFYNQKLVANYKGTREQEIIKLFKDYARNLDNVRKHQIRQKILSSQKMAGLNSIQVDLHVTLKHKKYNYQDQYSAAYLKVCKDPHAFHISFIATQLSQSGKLRCDKCQVDCQKTDDIQVEAFIMSYYDKIKNFEGSTLIFKKTPIGSMNKQQEIKNAELSQQKTVIPKKSEQGTSQIIEVKVLQIVKDDRLSSLNSQKLAQQIQKATGKQSLNFQNRQLIGYSFPLMINLICFHSKVRIRNPLFHKLCKPADHKNKLVAYSYENIYHQLFGQQAVGKNRVIKSDKVKCSFQQCPNYFDKNNFKDYGIVIENIKKQIYEEYRQCIYGSYYSNFYDKNWHSTLIENRLYKDYENNKIKIKRFITQIKDSVKSLVTTVNLDKAAKNVRSLYKKPLQQLKNITFFDQKFQIINVSLGDYNLCPVRCIKCLNFNAYDAFFIASKYKMEVEKTCPICKESLDKSSYFYDGFYIDLNLMKFIFFEGFAKEILFDLQKRIYFHKMSYYTASSLKQKLKQQKNSIIGNIYKYDINIKLDKAKRYIPFIDKRCSNNTKNKPHQINQHYIYLVESQRINDNVKCPICLIQVRSNTLQHNQQLQFALKNKNNELRWAGSQQADMISQNKSINSLKYYSQIAKDYQQNFDGKKIKMYWRNYQGSLIRYPFKFTKCSHSLETSICDFSDILYQIKVEGAKKFQCRYKQCAMVYESVEEMQKIQSLNIIQRIEESRDIYSRVMSQNAFWVVYNVSENEILDVSSKSNQKNNFEEELKITQQFRSKFTNNKKESMNRKDIEKQLKNIEAELKDIDLKIRQDEKQFVEKKTFIHSQNQTEFQGMKTYKYGKLNEKNRLLEQKRMLDQQQNEERRKQNNTNFINFNKLNKMYPEQIKKFEEKRRQELQNVEESVDRPQAFKTFGNLFIFDRPVKKFSAEVSSDLFWETMSKR